MADFTMDYDAVEEMADGFGTASQTLEAVSIALQAAIAILEATALVGSAGSAALAAYLENIKPNVDKLAETTDELSQDLRNAVSIIRDGDTTVSSRFASTAPS
ncbi:MAG: WXG100 family type VII secretion target [Anaerolineae bacterium]|nr:WXG100 family type VII secretion target [Anaerolineae bacterium]